MGNGRLYKSSHEYPSLREEAALQIDKRQENLVPDRDGTLQMLPFSRREIMIAIGTWSSIRRTMYREDCNSTEVNFDAFSSEHKKVSEASICPTAFE